MSTPYRGPPIDVSFQVWIHLTKRFQRRRFFLNQPIRNKSRLWRPCFLMDRDELSNLCREPSIVVSYQVSVDFAKQFQKRIFFFKSAISVEILHFEYIYLYLSKSYLSFNRWIFRNQPIRNTNCLWRPCLLTDRDKMSHLHRGPSIDSSYQVSVHLAKRFQRRRFFRNQPIRNKNCLWQPCLLMNRDKLGNH